VTIVEQECKNSECQCSKGVPSGWSHLGAQPLLPPRPGPAVSSGKYRGEGRWGHYNFVTLLLHCSYAVVTLVSYYCGTVVTRSLHCYYTVVTLLLHCCHTAVILLSHCCNTVVTLLSHCCCTAVTLLFHCCYTVVALLQRCYYTVASQLLDGCYTVVTDPLLLAIFIGRRRGRGVRSRIRANLHFLWAFRHPLSQNSFNYYMYWGTSVTAACAGGGK
jgi:hypothetical protein